MKVFILLSRYPYEGDVVEKVFATKALADVACTGITNLHEEVVEEWEVAGWPEEF